MKRVLFVCLGNICRSPTAEAVFRARAAQAKIPVIVASAGTQSWHIGAPPDSRSVAEAEGHGYDMSGLQAQKVQVSDFAKFDYILAMDQQNLIDLEQMRGGKGTKPQLFLDFANQQSTREVPDPYYGGPQGFANVVHLIEQASDGLLEIL
ncbi:Low molecular weight protein tyrosine phosphatase [hydrothermal vent metagenome]|uniref:protein-tyrosine-phosphatase n=1 Tax=hydrothermal vent metagenome TaxID=652676 RepID=A0A3B0SG31_9ZZZZ